MLSSPLHGRPPVRLLAAAALAAPLLLALPSHAAETAHAHGHAQLDVAVEPQTLSLRFSSPLDNLVGFERAPRNDKERRQVEAAVAKLKDAGALFRIDPSAQCKLARVELSSAVLGLGTVDPAEEEPGHADIDGSVDFNCVDAAKAAYIDVGLFEFKRLHRIEVQVAGPAGQSRQVLKPTAKRLHLKK